MKYKVYNENGTARVVKVCDNGTELLMFKVENGEVATINIVAHLHTGEGTKKQKIKN